MITQRIVTDPGEMAHYFLSYHFPIVLLKGFEPLCELICLYYQDQKIEKPYHELKKHYKRSYKNNIVHALKKGYLCAPDFMEEIVRHSLERAPEPLEFAREAAEWLREHRLLLNWEKEKSGLRYISVQWLWVPHGGADHRD